MLPARYSSGSSGSAPSATYARLLARATTPTGTPQLRYEYTVTRSDDSLVVARSHEVHVLHRFQKRNISAVRPTPYSQSRTRPLRLREDRECRVHPNNHVIMFIDRHSSPIRGRCILECGRPAQRTVHEILKIDQVQRAPGRDVSLPSYPALRYGVQGTSADIAYLTVNLVRLSSVIVFHMTT